MLQFLTELDPQPWEALMGFVPSKQVDRELRLGSGRVPNLDNLGNADLILNLGDGTRVLVELKLGHSFSADQKARYEAWGDETAKFALAALSVDRRALAGDEGWEFLELAELFGAWTSSKDARARALSNEVSPILQRWEQQLSGVFEPRGSKARLTLDEVRLKFLTRVIARRVCHELIDRRGCPTYAGVTSGGGLALAQAWAPIGGDEHRALMAEVRWSTSGMKLRFGVDYSLTESPESRREAYALALQMADAIRFDHLHQHLALHAHPLADALMKVDVGRPSAKGDWNSVVVHGFRSPSNLKGVAGSRRTVYPAFFGDGTQRFQAAGSINLSHVCATDLVDLLDGTLEYLTARIP